MPQAIDRTSALLVIAFVVLAGALGYWVASGPSLVARPDNPRRILDEQRILRGSILDRDGEIIVETTGELGNYVRRTRYIHAAPFTGYYSINYGTSGVERAFDDVLRGAAGVDTLQVEVNRLLHRNPAGRAVQLTIDLDIQRTADTLLSGRIGAIVVLSVPDGDILALSSQPTFDPNTLDENWDTLRADPGAPLLNRAVQGLYQPGTILQPIVLVEALQRDVAELGDAPGSPQAPYPIDSRFLNCFDPAGVVTIADAFRSACPAPFADLGAALGGDSLWDMTVTWQLTATSTIDVQSASALTQTVPLTDTRALRDFAVGQGPVTITPLQMARVAVALAMRGEMPAPRIVSATQTIERTWQAVGQLPVTPVAPMDIAEQVVSAMSHSDGAVWHAGVGLSGRSRALWFIGLTSAERPEYAVAVLLESVGGQPDDRVASRIGRALLNALADIDRGE